ncbi:kinase-like domain-containing protein [Lophiotrema nucula]|uniref:Kinase-like domain-containing protein n=1 Tax=Lophiotrema nucula TaxID=690887 RepID=A0A6A5YWV6_9PLEO|nr:kinase-like domain-containing protein [Lophiotrema nucula]
MDVPHTPARHRLAGTTFWTRWSQGARTARPKQKQDVYDWRSHSEPRAPPLDPTPTKSRNRGGGIPFRPKAKVLRRVDRLENTSRPSLKSHLSQKYIPKFLGHPGLIFLVDSLYEQRLWTPPCSIALLLRSLSRAEFLDFSRFFLCHEYDTDEHECSNPSEADSRLNIWTKLGEEWYGICSPRSTHAFQRFLEDQLFEEYRAITATGQSQRELEFLLDPLITVWLGETQTFRQVEQVYLELEGGQESNCIGKLNDYLRTSRSDTAIANSKAENSYEISLSSPLKSPTSVDFGMSNFLTAKSNLESTQPFFTAEIGVFAPMKPPLLEEDREDHDSDSFYKLLKEKNIWPVNVLLEKDWSGRGQHTGFKRDEKALLNDILEVRETLGSSATAIVESVKCRRILLARKTIRCNRNFTKEKAIEEVAHLNRLEHSHIIQVIGTYVMGNNLSILLYPATEYDLGTFLQDLDPRNLDCEQWKHRRACLCVFFGCLADAVRYIHATMTKHMDIKPRNILVRKRASKGEWMQFKVYLADFGIARSYVSQDACETDGPTTFTRKYAAPEVVDRQKRGLAADIFSLGCVFLEMLATLALNESVALSVNEWKHTYTALGVKEKVYKATKEIYDRDLDQRTRLQQLLEANEYGDATYQANTASLKQYLEQLNFLTEDNLLDTRNITASMLEEEPSRRPVAAAVAYGEPRHQCCEQGPDILEAAEET